MSLDLGRTPVERSVKPTHERKVAAAAGGDPEMEALLFQYGRYLLISCSRPGSLPANLQGLWNDNNSPAWHSDYHANINAQMNYWPAEPANLSECHQPFFDLMLSQLEPWRKATQNAKEFQTSSNNSRGFAIRTSHGIQGDMGWKWDNTANAWYGRHFWEHYAYTGDKEFLKAVAYPVPQGNLRVLGKSSQRAAGWPPGCAERLVPRAWPHRGRCQLQPADHLGPLRQLHRGQ